jgi:hypothetical protein
MVDFTSSNLQGANAQFNSIVSKLNDTKSSALANLQADASAAAEAIGSELSALKVELRNLIPEGTSLPNINLQSQLESLSGLVDPTQAANLLASITTSFGTELSASGFNLDTLVSDAAAAVTGGKSLSFDIPNFEKPADGVSAAIQKAVAVKIPSTDPIVEAVATFTENDTFTSLKTTASSSVLTTSTTLPTVDTAQLTITEKSTNITQGTITKAVTTSEDAIEGVGAELKRKNVSAAGFSSRPVLIKERILDDNVSGVVDLNFTLPNIPTRVSRLYGYDEEGRRWRIYEAPLSEKRKARYDSFTIVGNEITVQSNLRNYVEAQSFVGRTRKKGTFFKITYYINSTYDPNYGVD